MQADLSAKYGGIVNKLSPKQNGLNFMKMMSLKFVSMGPIDNK